MMLPELLLIEDDADQAAWVIRNLASVINVTWVDSAPKALAYLESKSFPLVLFDLRLGSSDGLALVAEMRSRRLIDDEVKIIAITSSQEEDDINNIHLANIHEVLYKPVKSSIFRSVIQKYLRQVMAKKSGEYRKGPFRFLLASKTVLFETASELIKLDISITGFKILLSLARSEGSILSRNQLLDSIGDEGDVNERVIDVHINSLRAASAYLRQHIVTHRGIGYRLEL